MTWECLSTKQFVYRIEDRQELGVASCGRLSYIMMGSACLSILLPPTVSIIHYLLEIVGTPIIQALHTYHLVYCSWTKNQYEPLSIPSAKASTDAKPMVFDGFTHPSCRAQVAIC